MKYVKNKQELISIVNDYFYSWIGIAIPEIAHEAEYQEDEYLYNIARYFIDIFNLFVNNEYDKTTELGLKYEYYKAEEIAKEFNKYVSRRDSIRGTDNIKFYEIGLVSFEEWIIANRK